MAGARSLADGHIKVAVLTTKPTDPSAPTPTELAAGIDAGCAILASDFNFGPTDSDKIAEKALCTVNNANAMGASNGQAAMTIFRYFDDTTKNSAATEDALWAALKVKGTTVWIYARETAKLSTEAWADTDEIYYGAEVLTDDLQRPQNAGGYIKSRAPMEVQVGYPNILATA